MSSLPDYQSVVQLGAALNFAFGAIEAITERPLLLLEQRYTELLDRFRRSRGVESLTDKDLVLLDRGGRVKKLARAVGQLPLTFNPYASTASGFACLILLIRSSATTCCRDMTTIEWTALLTVCYGWFTLMLLLQAVLRLWVEWHGWDIVRKDESAS